MAFNPHLTSKKDEEQEIYNKINQSNNNQDISGIYGNIYSNSINGYITSQTNTLSVCIDNEDLNQMNTDLNNESDNSSFNFNDLNTQSTCVNPYYPLLCYLTMLKDILLPREDGSFHENWIISAIQYQLKCEEIFLSKPNFEHVQIILPRIPRQLHYTSNKLKESSRMSSFEYENFKYLFSIIALGFLAKLKLLSFYATMISNNNENDFNSNSFAQRQMTQFVADEHQSIRQRSYGCNQGIHTSIMPRDEVIKNIYDFEYYNGGKMTQSYETPVMSEYYHPDGGRYDRILYRIRNCENENMKENLVKDMNTYSILNNYGGSISLKEKKTIKKRGRPRGCKSKKNI